MVAEGHGGAIVMVSSISAHVGAPEQVAYCGTKGAISMLGKALGAVLGTNGIRVNVIEPGAVATNMSAPMLEMPDVVKYYTRPDRAPPDRRPIRARRADRVPAVR